MNTKLSELRAELQANADDDYRIFDEKLNPRATTVLGVRMPVLRKIARNIVKTNFHQLLDDRNFGMGSFEENLLRGIVIATADMTTDESLQYLKDFVPSVTDWMTCDAVCASFRLHEDNLPKYWHFILRYQNSKAEFEVRFMFVMMLDYFLLPSYHDQILQVIDANCGVGYYAEMAAAWLLAESFVKDYDKTLHFMKSRNQLSPFVFKKSLTKACESFRITPEQKSKLQSLRKLK